MRDQENESLIVQIEIEPMANFAYVVESRGTLEVAIVDSAWDIAEPGRAPRCRPSLLLRGGWRQRPRRAFPLLCA